MKEDGYIKRHPILVIIFGTFVGTVLASLSVDLIKGVDFSNTLLLIYEWLFLRASYLYNWFWIALILITAYSLGLYFLQGVALEIDKKIKTSLDVSSGNYENFHVEWYWDGKYPQDIELFCKDDKTPLDDKSRYAHEYKFECPTCEKEYKGKMSSADIRNKIWAQIRGKVNRKEI